MLISNLRKQAELPEDLTATGSAVPHVKATQVTTRTALTKEDKEKNSTTSQIEEKTFTATTMTTAHRQEQRVVTQEVRTATILTSAEPTQVCRHVLNFPDFLKKLFQISMLRWISYLRSSLISVQKLSFLPSEFDSCRIEEIQFPPFRLS